MATELTELLIATKTRVANTKEVKRLRRAIRASLTAQGFTVAKDSISFRQKRDKRSIRKRHEHAVAKKAELANPVLARAMGGAFRCTVVRRGEDILGFVTSLRDGDTAIAYCIDLTAPAKRKVHGAKVP